MEVYHEAHSEAANGLQESSDLNLPFSVSVSFPRLPPPSAFCTPSHVFLFFFPPSTGQLFIPSHTSSFTQTSTAATSSAYLPEMSFITLLCFLKLGFKPVRQQS